MIIKTSNGMIVKTFVIDPTGQTPEPPDGIVFKNTEDAIDGLKRGPLENEVCTLIIVSYKQEKRVTNIYRTYTKSHIELLEWYQTYIKKNPGYSFF
jgi:hypothetical protein